MRWEFAANLRLSQFFSGEELCYFSEIGRLTHVDFGDDLCRDSSERRRPRLRINAPTLEFDVPSRVVVDVVVFVVVWLGASPSRAERGGRDSEEEGEHHEDVGAKDAEEGGVQLDSAFEHEGKAGLEKKGAEFGRCARGLVRRTKGKKFAFSLSRLHWRRWSEGGDVKRHDEFFDDDALEIKGHEQDDGAQGGDDAGPDWRLPELGTVADHDQRRGGPSGT